LDQQVSELSRRVANYDRLSSSFVTTVEGVLNGSVLTGHKVSLISDSVGFIVDKLIIFGS
jgi:hypothetical protein